MNYFEQPRATSFAFFSIKIPLKAAYFEEKIYRKVEKVKEVEEKKVKKDLRAKTYSTCSTWWLKFLSKLDSFRNMKVNDVALRTAAVGLTNFQNNVSLDLCGSCSTTLFVKLKECEMAGLLEELRRLNPHIAIDPVESKKFARYGMLHKAAFPGLVKTSLEAFPVSAPGGGYIRSLDALEIHPEAAVLRNGILGQMDGEIGVCWGHNHYLNGLEWHNCTEVTIAASPLVVLLGDLRDMENGRFDSHKAEAFFVDSGQVIEIYSTTMHLAPCEVREGFNCLVVLPRGTNYPLEAVPGKHDPALHSRNKWLVAHEENKEMVEGGSPPAIYGPNWEIKPLQ